MREYKTSERIFYFFHREGQERNGRWRVRETVGRPPVPRARPVTQGVVACERLRPRLSEAPQRQSEHGTLFSVVGA